MFNLGELFRRARYFWNTGLKGESQGDKLKKKPPGRRTLFLVFSLAMMLLAFTQSTSVALAAAQDFNRYPLRSDVVIVGHVGLNRDLAGGGDAGLGGVEIYASVSYWVIDFVQRPATLLAVTDENGFFRGTLHNLLPGSRIRVWAVKDGYTFEPPEYVWRHWFKERVKILTFRAQRVDPPPPPPGLTIQGHVWQRERVSDQNRRGLANVNIYAITAVRNTDLVEVVLEPVAVTDEDGFYQAHLGDVPPNTWVMVWAEKEAYTFDPPRYVWKHGPEEVLKTLNFLAIPTRPLPELRVEGHVLQAIQFPTPHRQGVPDVNIFATFPPSPYDLRPSILIRVGVTDEDGFYQGSLGFVPPGTVVKLWAMKKGYRFEPKEYVWEHRPISDPQPRVLNFKAIPIHEPTPTFTPTPTPTSSPTPTSPIPTFTPTAPIPTPTPLPEPRTEIEGRVRLEVPDGPGVPDVRIYQSPPYIIEYGTDATGTPIAVTNRRGYYRGELKNVEPGDEVWIWAVKESYLFKPRYYRIRVSYDPQLRRYDFIAFLIPEIPPPEEIPLETTRSSIR